MTELRWRLGTIAEANPLLAEHHYLGPMKGGRLVVLGGVKPGRVVACQVWRTPTSRRLPSDGSRLELSRWCLTPDAGENAGSKMHKAAVRLIRERHPEVVALVSYSDPSAGHTGALYRACNWVWRPAWNRLRPPPSRGGTWDGVTVQAVKDRWVFFLRPSAEAEAVVALDDMGAIRYWRKHGTAEERRWARAHPQLREGL